MASTVTKTQTVTLFEQHTIRYVQVKGWLMVRTFIYHRSQGNQNSSGLQCEVAYSPAMTQVAQRM